MPTVTIYGEPDGQVQSTDTTYATAREGGSLALGTTVLSVGQSYNGTNFVCSEGFVGFDTSTLVGPKAALLELSGLGTVTTHFTAEVRVFDWGATLTTADFVAGSTLAALTLVATLDTTTAASSGYNTYTDVALAANLDTGGITRLVVSSSRHRSATPAVNGVDEMFAATAASQSGGTTNDPRIVVTYSTVSTDDILNPDMDVAINGWTTDTGATTDLYTAIDELTASDTDYIQSPAGPTTVQYYETALETKADPLSSSGHIVHYRYQKNVAGGNVGLTVDLRSGAADITQDTIAGTGQGDANSTYKFAQSFTWAGGLISSVELALSKNGTPTDTITVSLEADSGGVPSGTTLASATMAASSLTGTATFYVFTFAAAFSAAAGTYWIVWSRATTDGSNFPSWWDATGAYAGGVSKDYTGSWSSANPADRAFRVRAQAQLASWSHTNIPNTWTQQDQTLTAPQADSITDYSNLRLRFTPNMVTTDQTVPVPTKVADRATANSNTATTTVDLVLTSLTVGNYLLIRSAANNVGGGGSATGFTLSNFSGTAIDLATDQVFQANVDPGAAGVGATCSFAIVKISATLGTVRITYGGSVVQACVAEEWSGIHATTPIVGTPVAATGTNVTTFVNTPAMTDTSVALGNVVYGLIAVEGPSSDTYTQDADTTNGSWVSLTKLGTTIATADLNQTTYGAYKTVTATGAQTYNPTGSVARDSAGLIVELAAAPTPAATIKAQVSWANLELPAGVTAFPHYAGINLGVNWPVDGAISAGATDS